MKGSNRQSDTIGHAFIALVQLSATCRQHPVLAIAAGPLYRGSLPAHPAIRRLDLYPMAAYLRAFDAAISAAGGSVTLLPLPFKQGRPPVKGNQFTNR